MATSIPQRLSSSEVLFQLLLKCVASNGPYVALQGAAQVLPSKAFTASSSPKAQHTCSQAWYVGIMAVLKHEALALPGSPKREVKPRALVDSTTYLYIHAHTRMYMHLLTYIHACMCAYVCINKPVLMLLSVCVFEHM